MPPPLATGGAAPPADAARARAAPRLEPDARLQFLPGIGPRRAEHFARLRLSTVEHLFRHSRRAWLDARRFVRIRDLPAHELVTVEGTLRSAAAVRTRGGRTDFAAVLEDGSGRLGLYFFGQS